MKNCPVCGGECPKEAPFCPFCGTPFVSPSDPSSASVKPEQPMGMFCPMCGKRTPESSRFCPFCGFSLPQSQPQAPEEPPRMRTCSICGCQSPESSDFCPYCGVNFPKGSAASVGILPAISPEPVPEPLPPAPPADPEEAKRSRMAIAGFAVSLLGFVSLLCFPVQLFGLILSFYGAKSKRRRVLSTVGVILSAAALVLSLIAWPIIFVNAEELLPYLMESFTEINM